MALAANVRCASLCKPAHICDMVKGSVGWCTFSVQALSPPHTHTPHLLWIHSQTRPHDFLAERGCCRADCDPPVLTSWVCPQHRNELTGGCYSYETEAIGCSSCSKCHQPIRIGEAQASTVNRWQAWKTADQPLNQPQEPFLIDCHCCCCVCALISGSEAVQAFLHSAT